MPRAVRTRLFTLAVAAYVLLDFSSPYLPGVFSFDADQSMDGVLEGSSPAVVPTSDALCKSKRGDRARHVPPSPLPLSGLSSCGKRIHGRQAAPLSRKRTSQPRQSPVLRHRAIRRRGA